MHSDLQNCHPCVVCQLRKTVMQMESKGQDLGCQGAEGNMGSGSEKLSGTPNRAASSSS